VYRIVVAMLAVLVFGTTVWWLRREPAAAPDSAPQPHAVMTAAQAAKPARAGEAPTPSGSAEATSDAAEPAGQPDLYARLRASNDYYEFASGVFDAAKQGDPAAQYYLSSALAYCESLYDWYFIVYGPDGTPRHRTLDEAQQLTAQRPVFKPDDVRDIQQRCQKLRKTKPPPFGTSQEWLAASAGSDFPLAQVNSALNFAMQGHQRSDADKALAARDEARRLALESLRTRDPKVMAQMGSVAANLAGDDAAAARKAQWVWPLAACLRETHCESMADWMRLFCNIDTQCQPFETPVDIIRRQAGNDYDEIERRARELNEKIDAGTLEEGDI
jgi:hypothetical protein